MFAALIERCAPLRLFNQGRASQARNTASNSARHVVNSDSLRNRHGNRSPGFQPDRLGRLRRSIGARQRSEGSDKTKRVKLKVGVGGKILKDPRHRQIVAVSRPKALPHRIDLAEELPGQRFRQDDAEGLDQGGLWIALQQGEIKKVEEVGIRRTQLFGVDGRAVLIAEQRLPAERQMEGILDFGKGLGQGKTLI